MSISRRRFFENAAAGTLAAQVALNAASGKTLPARTLGQTGAKVSIVALGCGSRLLSYEHQDNAVEAVNKAIDSGITYIDTAYGYGNGKSETWVGEVMKVRRKEVWLATKINIREPEEAKRTIEGSLKRLQTDHVDLLHIHSLTDAADLAKIEEKGGVLDIVHNFRDQKVARFIGITSHTDPMVLKTALERHDFDCTQMALNAARVGMRSVPGGMDTNKFATSDSFEMQALPVAVRKKMGIIAMKIFAQEKLVGTASIERLIRYSLSLPVTCTVLGMPKLDYIEENTTIARNFKPLTKTEMQSMAGELLPLKAELDSFFADHVDA